MSLMMDKTLFLKLSLYTALSIGVLADVMAAQMTETYASSKSRPKTLLVMPSFQIKESRKGYSRDDSEAEIRAELDRNILKKLEKSGFEVVALTREDLGESKKKQQLYNGVIVEYANTLDEFLQNESMVKYNWFGLGRSSALLADLYQVDALVLSNLVIEPKNLSEPNAKRKAEHRIIVVDGETANFEASFFGSTKFNDMTDPKKRGKAAKKLVNKSLLAVKNARKLKPTLLPDVELKAKQKFTPIAEEEALLEELKALIPDIYTPFNFKDDVDEERLLNDLEKLLE